MNEELHAAAERAALACQCSLPGGACPVEAAIRVMGGKWKPLILWYLYHEGTKRFGELRRCVPNATEKMITQHLRELEADDLVRREVYAVVPPKVEYSLTDHGRAFGPVLLAMYDWGVAYGADEHSSQSRQPQSL
jgi:DNA-binding HxlR family transcriptional regulator